MTTTPTSPAAKLTERVAEEIRAVMGRRRITGAELARRLDVSQMWVSYRLNGRQPINLTDLERIAEALGVTVRDLIPDFPPESITRRYSTRHVRVSPIIHMPATTRRIRDHLRPPDRRPVGRPMMFARTAA